MERSIDVEDQIVNAMRTSLFVAGLIALAAATSTIGAETWQTTFDDAKSDLVTTGRNPYFILEPGYVLTLEGREDGERAVLTITVLDDTRTVDGVDTRIVEERETVGGEPVEVSRNYFAISEKTGNVYYFGEETTNYEDGRAEHGADSWEAGVDGAVYGLFMPGRPEVGLKHYQEQAPGVAMDRAEVVSVSEKVKVPAGKFHDCLKVEETTALDKDEREFKLYAPGVGLLVDGGLKLTRYGVREP